MTFATIAFLANTLAAGAGASCLATVSHWFFLRRADIPVTKVQFFLGPGAFKFKWRGTTVEVGSIPCGSNVVSDEASLRALHRGWHLLILLSGPATLLLLAMLVLGPEAAFGHFVHGFPDLLEGVLHPKTAGPQLVAQLHAIYEVSFLKAAAVLSAKLAALNLFPFAGPTFFQVGRLFFKNEEHPMLQRFGEIHMASTMVLFGFWGYVMMYYALAAK